jgi:hypothetical protein
VRLLTALLVGALATAALASERSELLVAQGEVAYNAGRLEEARDLFTRANADDPNDVAAKGWLDVLAAGLPQGPERAERPEAAGKPWDVEAGTGVEYDSNVQLDHSNGKEDAGFLFTLRGHYDPYRDDRTLLRLDYDFFQVIHTQERDFDYRSQRFRATASRSIVPGLWVGVQGGYDHGTLDTHAYLQEPWVMPYVSYVEGDRGSTQVMYRVGNQDYLGSPFGVPTLDRDGISNAVGVNQLLFFFDRRLAANVGYTYEEATPYHASGNDFAVHTHQARAGVRFPAYWRTLVDLDYVYRYDGYTKLNSAVDFRKKRVDNGNYMSLAIRRPIIDHLDGVLTYFATVNPSNIQRYDYDRNVVSLELRYVF